LSGSQFKPPALPGVSDFAYPFQGFFPVDADGFPAKGFVVPKILDVFQNPVGFGTRPAVFQAKALQNRVLSGSCSETEVSEQL
jgi:hypothetical protein